jgi:sugar phosphate isomerase/epimerase
MKISATTVMIPEYDLRETAALLSKLGFHGVEWRVRRIPAEQLGKPFSFWGNHKNDLTPERFLKEAKEIRKLCDDHNLQLVALAPAVAADKLDEVKLIADAAAGATNGEQFRVMVRIGAPKGYNGTIPYPVLYEEAVDAYGKALEVTKSRGVKMALEIHGGTIMVSASLVHRIVSHFSPEHIGAIYDVNNQVRDGYETPKLAMELLGKYLAHVHLGAHRPMPGPRDDKGAVAWKWEPCPLDEGLWHMPTLFATLKAVGYNGFVSIEDFRQGKAEEKLLEASGILKRFGVWGE